MIGARSGRSFDTMRIDEPSLADQSRTARIAIVAGTLFGAIAALHGLWATGVTWPFRGQGGPVRDLRWGGVFTELPQTWKGTQLAQLLIALATPFP